MNWNQNDTLFVIWFEENKYYTIVIPQSKAHIFRTDLDRMDDITYMSSNLVGVTTQEEFDNRVLFIHKCYIKLFGIKDLQENTVRQGDNI
jgi:hypothetical protein